MLSACPNVQPYIDTPLRNRVHLRVHPHTHRLAEPGTVGAGGDRTGGAGGHKLGA